MTINRRDFLVLTDSLVGAEIAGAASGGPAKAAAASALVTPSALPAIIPAGVASTPRASGGISSGLRGWGRLS